MVRVIDGTGSCGCMSSQQSHCDCKDENCECHKDAKQVLVDYK